MPIYRVDGVRESGGMATQLLVRAASEAEARNGAARLGIRSQTITPIGVADLPEGAEVIDLKRPPSVGADAHLERVASSAIIRHPILTIAGGVMVGMIGLWIVRAVITAAAAWVMSISDATPSW